MTLSFEFSILNRLENEQPSQLSTANAGKVGKHDALKKSNYKSTKTNKKCDILYGKREKGFLQYYWKDF